MNFIGVKPKKIVFFPDALFEKKYIGELWGKHFAKSKVFNVFSDEESKQYATIRLGEIFATKPNEIQSNTLIGWWDAEKLLFQFNGEEYAFQKYNLFQNIFSRNTGILESDMLHNKCAFILGCGSVGSLVALELARTGIGKFVLVDNDILEYHNLCRHQCSISEVGEYKVDALKRRILEINPSAEVEPIVSTVEMLDRPVFDTFCLKEQTVLIGCADNRSADVYANSISVMYGIPFLSIGFWERAFAGEIFYYLPRKNMPCYKCALGDGNLMSQRTSTNRRLYTNEEDLSKVNFEPGISVDINFVTTIGIKLLLDIFNLDNDEYTPRLLSTLTQYTLVFGINVDDTITDIKCDVSDRHFCGKCVVIVSFQSKKIVYKPRNMSVDFFWMKVANWISDIDNQIEVRAANVLVGNDYGFVEWIEADLNLCKEEIEKYIYRCGNLLGVVSLLGGSDFHYENVICSGATPILIDVETLILPSVKQIYANDHNSLQLDVYMRTQFMRTLLLPKWIGNSPENAIDIGGFSAVHNNGINLPKDFEGRIVEFGELPELFIKGYKDVLKTILEHKAEYLELIEDVKSINFRYILRNTRVYYNLLRYFSNPIYLKNNNIFSCVTSRIFTPYLLIGNEEVTREMWPVGQVEYDEIKKFHIPIFSVNGNSTDLMGSDGKIVLKNYFYISPYNYVSETIELLDDQLIDIQIRYLLDVINVHNVQKKNSYNWQISYFDIKRKWMSINNKSSLFEYCNNLLASIQSAVSNCTLNEELELYFAPVKDSRTGRYSMDIMKDALYSGRYGVQIFLEMYYHFYGFEQRKKALENRVLKMANDFYLNTNEMKWFNLSFTNGVASLLMELRNFALISNRNSFVEMIFKIIKSIPEKNITRSEESDYYNGIAGLLYIICDCYKKFNVDIDLYARNLIEYIVTDLFKRCDICGLWFQEEFYHQPLTGLAHGQSGYALALSKALPYINEGMRLKVTSQIQKCMDYEYNCYDNSEMNLPDYRKLLLKKGGDKSQKKFMYGYCSGILGTALVVSELSEELISFQKKEIWKMNAVQYLKKDILIGNDSLCCGTAGWIDYLASCHKNEEWSDELFKKIIFSINEQGYVFNGLEGVNEISLFKGMSGIGYSVLRYMGKYPSVLL